MSGSVPGTEGSKADPNLTPLLDLVLQLVMFFMLTTNFIMENVNETIRLPQAIAARALDKTMDNFIILNVNEQGKVLLGRGKDAETLENAIQVTNYMKNLYDLDKARTKPADWEKGKGRSIVILRGHKDCNYKQIDDVMKACQRAGYTDIQLRAIKVAG
jgi:biopolymer transport protein ExbD